MAVTGLEQALEEAAWQGLQRATVYAQAQLMQALNVPNSGERRKRTRNTSAGTKGSTFTVYPYPSRPGEPPRKRTGWLQAHVQYRLDRPTLSSTLGVGQNALYGIFLDLGTRTVAARPWLLATVNKVLPQLAALAGYGISASRAGGAP